MNSNIGKADKVIRIFFTIVITGLYIESQISGFGAVLLLLIAGYFLATSFIGYCPLYKLLGISTGAKKS